MIRRLHKLAPLVIMLACGGSAQRTAEFPTPAETVAEGAQAPTNFKSVIAVIPVKDHVVATAWYRSWIGREADVAPMEGIAEWKLADGGWLQVAHAPDDAGSTTIVVGVVDAEAQRAAFEAAALATGEVQDLGYIKLVEAVDPDGNKVVFIQETGAPSVQPSTAE